MAAFKAGMISDVLRSIQRPENTDINIYLLWAICHVLVMTSNATVAKRVTHLSSNSEDVGSIPGTGRYIVTRMTT